jgi:tRNA threonylcarbamoyladenosine biosynthesis protein TsaE
MDGMKDSQLYISKGVQQTRNIGFFLGKILKKQDVIGLVGELGCGKTVFTQGIARGLGIKGYITSPSFTIINEYPGPLPLYHIDLYRIKDKHELLELGLEEYYEGNGVCVIEWFEHLGLKQGYLEIRFEILNQRKRRLIFIPHGQRPLDIIKKLKAR